MFKDVAELIYVVFVFIIAIIVNFIMKIIKNQELFINYKSRKVKSFIRNLGKRNTPIRGEIQFV